MIAVITIPKSYSSAFMDHAVNRKHLRVGPTEAATDKKRYPAGDLEHFYFHYYMRDAYGMHYNCYDFMFNEWAPDVDLTEKISLKNVDIIKMPVPYWKAVEYFEPDLWIITERDPEVVAKRLEQDEGDGKTIENGYEHAKNMMDAFKAAHPEAIIIDMDKFIAGDKSHADEVLDEWKQSQGKSPSDEGNAVSEPERAA